MWNAPDPVLLRGDLDPRFYDAVARLAASLGIADPFVAPEITVSEQLRAVVDGAQTVWDLRDDPPLRAWAWRHIRRALVQADQKFATLDEHSAKQRLTSSAVGTAARWAAAVGAFYQVGKPRAGQASRNTESTLRDRFKAAVYELTPRRQARTR